MSLFELGRVVMTSGIRDLIEMDGPFHTFIHDCLKDIRKGIGEISVRMTRK